MKNCKITYMAISNRIKEAREAAGLSKSELARRVGVSHTAVGLWEDGSTKNLKDIHIFKIAENTGVSAQYLLYGSNQTKSQSVHESTTKYGQDEKTIRLVEAYKNAPAELQDAVARVLGIKD